MAYKWSTIVDGEVPSAGLQGYLPWPKEREIEMRAQRLRRDHIVMPGKISAVPSPRGGGGGETINSNPFGRSPRLKHLSQPQSQTFQQQQQQLGGRSSPPSLSSREKLSVSSSSFYPSKPVGITTTTTAAIGAGEGGGGGFRLPSRGTNLSVGDVEAATRAVTAEGPAPIFLRDPMGESAEMKIDDKSGPPPMAQMHLLASLQSDSFNMKSLSDRPPTSLPQWQARAFSDLSPPDRRDVKKLRKWLSKRVEEVRKDFDGKNPDDLAVQLLALYGQGMQELARQTAVHCSERGGLLLDIWLSQTALFDWWAFKLHRDKQRSQTEKEHFAKLFDTVLGRLLTEGDLEDFVRAKETHIADLTEKVDLLTKEVEVLRIQVKQQRAIAKESTKRAAKLTKSMELWLPNLEEYHDCSVSSALERESKKDVELNPSSLYLLSFDLSRIFSAMLKAAPKEASRLRIVADDVFRERAKFVENPMGNSKRVVVSINGEPTFNERLMVERINMQEETILALEKTVSVESAGHTNARANLERILIESNKMRLELKQSVAVLTRNQLVIANYARQLEERAPIQSAAPLNEHEISILLGTFCSECRRPLIVAPPAAVSRPSTTQSNNASTPTSAASSRMAAVTINLPVFPFPSVTLCTSLCVMVFLSIYDIGNYYRKLTLPLPSFSRCFSLYFLNLYKLPSLAEKRIKWIVGGIVKRQTHSRLLTLFLRFLGVVDGVGISEFSLFLQAFTLALSAPVSVSAGNAIWLPLSWVEDMCVILFPRGSEHFLQLAKHSMGQGAVAAAITDEPESMVGKPKIDRDMFLEIALQMHDEYMKEVKEVILQSAWGYANDSLFDEVPTNAVYSLISSLASPIPPLMAAQMHAEALQYSEVQKQKSKETPPPVSSLNLTSPSLLQAMGAGAGAERERVVWGVVDGVFRNGLAFTSSFLNGAIYQTNMLKARRVICSEMARILEPQWEAIVRNGNSLKIHEGRFSQRFMELSVTVSDCFQRIQSMLGGGSGAGDEGEGLMNVIVDLECAIHAAQGVLQKLAALTSAKEKATAPLAI